MFNKRAWILKGLLGPTIGIFFIKYTPETAIRTLIKTFLDSNKKDFAIVVQSY